MCPKGLCGSSVPNIVHIRQHRLMHMLTPWVVLGLSLTIITLPLFGVVVASLSLCLLTRTTSSLSRLHLSTLHSLSIAPLLFMTHFYMLIIPTVSLTTFLSSVSLLSLTACYHCLRVYYLLHRDKFHLQRYGVKT